MPAPPIVPALLDAAHNQFDGIAIDMPSDDEAVNAAVDTDVAVSSAAMSNHSSDSVSWSFAGRRHLRPGCRGRPASEAKLEYTSAER